MQNICLLRKLMFFPSLLPKEVEKLQYGEFVFLDLHFGRLKIFQIFLFVFIHCYHIANENEKEMLGIQMMTNAFE